MSGIKRQSRFDLAKLLGCKGDKTEATATGLAADVNDGRALSLGEVAGREEIA
jgi:hypothetical protein